MRIVRAILIICAVASSSAAMAQSQARVTEFGEPSPMPVLPEADRRNWVAVGPVTSSSTDVVAQCTGTLIAPDLVLTAAHCVPQAVGQGQRFFVAGWNDARMVLRARSVESRIHPNYKSDTGQSNALFDVATLRLERPVSSAILRPLPLKPYLRSLTGPFGIVGYHSFRPQAVNGRFDCARAPEPRFSEMHLACFVVSGNSGSPVLTMEDDIWSVVGVLVATLGPAGAVGVPVDAWVLRQWAEAQERTAFWK